MKSLRVLWVAWAGGFGRGFGKLYKLRFAAGDIYPPYSSLRADPMGSKALYESILQLPGASAARNYLPIEKAPRGNATLLFLGLYRYLVEASPEHHLTALERLPRTGARAGIAMRPPPRRTE